MNSTIELLNLKVSLLITKHSMDEREVLDLLGNEFPRLNDALEKTPNGTNIYKAVQCFADFTKALVNKGNLTEVKHCFSVAEKLLKDGNTAVKNAIENVYVFSVSKCLDFATPLSYKIKGMMNDFLLKEYNRQISASGI